MNTSKYSWCLRHVPAEMKICVLPDEHNGDHLYVADESLEGRAAHHAANLDDLLYGRRKYA